MHGRPRQGDFGSSKQTDGLAQRQHPVSGYVEHTRCVHIESAFERSDCIGLMQELPERVKTEHGRNIRLAEVTSEVVVHVGPNDGSRTQNGGDPATTWLTKFQSIPF